MALLRLARRQKDELALADLYRERLAVVGEGPDSLATQLDLLDCLYRLEDADAVAEMCVKLVEHAPEVDLPRTSLGMICEELELWSEALTCYGSAAERSPERVRVTARYQCGLLAEEFREDAVAATECYQLVLDDDPRYAMALDGLERLCTQSGDREGLARLYANQAKDGAGNPVGTFYALLAGDLHHELSRFDDAAGYYEQAFEDPVGRERAFEALRRIHLRNRDGAALAGLTLKLAEDLPAAEAQCRRMDLADGLFQIGDEDRVIETYDGLLSDYEDLVVPAFHLKVMYSDREDWNGALSVLEIIQDRAVSKAVRTAVADQINGVLRDRFIDRPEARDFFQRLYDKDKKNPAALKGLGAISFKEENYDDAFLYFDELKDNTDDPVLKAVAVYHLGRVTDIKEGKPEDAAKAYEEALELDPNLVGPIDALIDLHTRSENWQALVGVLSRQASMARDKDKIGIYAEIARVWEDRIDNSELAIKSWERVVAQDVLHLEAYDRLMGLHAAGGDHRKVIEVGRAKVEQLPEDRRADLLFELGNTAANELRSEDVALGLYEQAAASPGSHQGALGGLREMASRRGDWDQVVELAGREAELVDEPRDRIDLYLARAGVRLNKQIDREGACPDFRRVLELDPENRQALRFFVDYHYDRKAWKEALPVFESYRPTIEEMDVEEDEDIREEVTLYWFKHGRVLAFNERGSEALECFRTALELTPTHVPSLREAAPRLMELEDWKGAANYYRQVLRLLGGFGDRETLTEATLNLGRCELRMGKPDAAVKRFTKILERSPNDVGALEGMADVHRQNKDWNTLLSTYNAIIKYAKSAEQVIDAYLQKGDILEEKLGYSDKAALHYEKVLMYDKTNHLAMLRLSEIALSREDLDKARKWAEVGERTASEADDTKGIVRSKLLQAIAAKATGEDGAAHAEAAISQASDERSSVEDVVKGIESSASTEDLLKTYRKHFARL